VYSPQVIDHFEHPRNSGVVENPDASVQVENPVCGDVLKLSAKVVEGRISDIKFLAQGCVPTVACASRLTELLRNRTIEEARAVTRRNLVQLLGGLPEAAAHASSLATDALAELLKRLK
jgi:nitrogen fixation NifU-like protein